MNCHWNVKPLGLSTVSRLTSRCNAEKIKALMPMIPEVRGTTGAGYGDHQQVRTTVCVDTIFESKRIFMKPGNLFICIYVAIGQKASARSKILLKTLEMLELWRTLPICCCNASDPLLCGICSFLQVPAIGRIF